jgi:hypothetical protein
MQFVYHIGKTKSGQNGARRTQKGNLELDWDLETGVDGKNGGMRDLVWSER